MTATWWNRATPAPAPAHFLLDRLWGRYVEDVPHAATFARLARMNSGRFENDHIALRTLARNGPGSGIRTFSSVFERLGWTHGGDYQFNDVHLRAVHLSKPELPRIFISELDPNALPSDARAALLESPEGLPAPDDDDALAAWFRAPPPPPAWALDVLAETSQYGAWLLCFGRKVNHFTASVTDVEEWQQKLLHAGVPMKSEIEGDRGGPLRQTATAAVALDVTLADGSVRAMPCSYFEIAERKPGFDGFLGPQARQLFDMTANNAHTITPVMKARKHPRRDVLLHVELVYGGVRVPVSTENLSLGGLFLNLPDDASPEPHTVLEMGLDLPSGRVHATGTVIYKTEGRGVGVEFTWWDDEDDPARQQLASFLTSLMN